MVDVIVPHSDAAENFALSVRGERILFIHVEKKEEEKKEGWNIIEDSPPLNIL